MPSVDYDDSNVYGYLSRNLYKLVNDDLFADVYFEVEGKRIAAHRNILSCRSDYFAAMLGRHANFRESSQQNPIYVAGISYDVFIQVLNFLYTGHIDANIDTLTAMDLIRASDLYNMNNLEELMFYHLELRISDSNCIKVFREACEQWPKLPRVIQLCYNVMAKNFDELIKSEEFCSLPQEMMINIIEQVLPNLAPKEIAPPPPPPAPPIYDVIYDSD